MMKLKTELFDYQKQAVDKLSHVKVGALYMEMGTGKTRTALELIQRRLQVGKVEQVLWLCPFSLQRDLPELLAEHAEDFESQIRIAGIESLSNSARIANELLTYVTLKSTFLVVDESLLIKNPFAYRTQRVIDIADKCKYKLILNGTPISRNEADLFAQWYVLDWRILGYKSYYSFATNHLEMDERHPDKIKRVVRTDYLAKKIAPYTFECSKDDVLNLPQKRYLRRDFNLDFKQKQEYERVYNILLPQVNESAPETIYRLFGALQAVTSGFAIRFSDNQKHYEIERMYQSEDNPRIQCLCSLLKEIGDKRVVIYCRYVQEITDICEILGGKAVPFFGEMSQAKRQASKNKFKNGEAQYFVANKSCARFGLNLQFCSCEVFYDNDWDWGTRAQAEDRIHRVGQKEKVYIYDIFACDTLDEAIINCLEKKEKISKIFKENLKSSSARKALSARRQ